VPPLQDFGNYVMTFPNYYVVGPNVAFFAQHGVKGLFEEGPPSDIGDGTDMEESAPPPPLPVACRRRSHITCVPAAFEVHLFGSCLPGQPHGGEHSAVLETAGRDPTGG